MWRDFPAGYALLPRLQLARFDSRVVTADAKRPRQREETLRGSGQKVVAEAASSSRAATIVAATVICLAAFAATTTRTEQPAVIRFAAAANFTWAQRLTCADTPSPEIHRFTQPLGPESRPRRSWRDPPLNSLCCAPPSCFRAVLDGAIALPPPEPPERPLPPDSPPAPPPVLDERRYDADELAAQIQEVLASRFGVSRVSPVFPRLKTAYAWRRSPGAVDGSTPPRWGELHADYFESDRFVYSAVLFLGAEDGDATPLLGGELGLVDAMEEEVGPLPPSRDGGGAAGAAAPVGPGRLTAGVVVEPKRGRLVVFTASGENYHSPLPVRAGRRTSFQVWFECACTVE